MTDQVLIQLEGEDGLRKGLDQVAAAVADLQPLYDLIGTLMVSKVAQRFQSKTDPTGAPWAPLAKATLARYAREDAKQGKREGSILQRFNDMYRSLGYEASAAHVEIGFSSATKDGKWQKAILHEFGTEHMPRRGMLTADPEKGRLGTEDREDIEDLIGQYLADAMAGGGVPGASNAL